MKTLIYLVFILIFIGCRKDTTETVNYTYLDESLKSKFSFNEGSYWIYQDQLQNIDSVVLTIKENGFTHSCPGCSRNEFIELIYTSQKNGTDFNHYLMADFIRYNGGGDFGQNGQPIYITKREEGYEFNGLIVGKVLDSLVILNATFYNVEKMSVQADSQYQREFEFDTDIYFAPMVGIIREVIFDSINGTTTRDLKRFNLK